MHWWKAAAGLLVFLPAFCWAQFFPQEIASTVKLLDFAALPVALNETDDYLYTQYTRIPFTSSSPLDRSYQLASEMYESTRMHTQTLQNLYEHPLFLNRNQMAKSVGSSGDEARIQAFANKLISGQAVTVVALGGSITSNHGCGNHSNGYTSRLFDWIETTFPNEGHRLLNQATPSTTSSYVAPCVLTLIPQDADLVTIEFDINDNADDKERVRLAEQRQLAVEVVDGMDKPSRHAMERMLRTVLSIPSSPAVIYIHAWAGMLPQKFYEGVEDHLTTMMSYYGIPSLSFRNAMYHPVTQDPELARRIWANREWGPDIHPSDAGGRFMADMVIGFLMDQAATAAWVRHASLLHRLHDPDNMAATLTHPATPTRQLPLPLFEGNFGNYSTDCHYAEDIKGYVHSNTGFNFTSEGPEWDPRSGYVSWQPGSQLQFKLPLDNVTYNGEEIVVGLGMLLSYSEVMGMAQIGCSRGCTCQPSTFSTRIEYAGYSMTYWQFLTAQVPAGVHECVVHATNLNQTFSEGHKVKVTSLLVSGELGTLEAGNAWLEKGTVGPTAVDSATEAGVLTSAFGSEQLSEGS